jgi:hypothetical protein
VAYTPSRGATRNLRWLFAGSCFAVLPVIASFPSSRLLLVALIGFTPLLAGFVQHAWSAFRARGPRSARVYGVLASALMLGLFHVITPSWLTRSEIVGLHYGASAIRQAVLHMDAGPELAQQRVVVLAALEGGTSMYIPLTRKRHGLAAPKASWTLSLAQAPHLLSRDSARSFTLLVLHGYTMLATAPEQLLRAPAYALRAGDRVDLGGLQVTVLRLLRGMPVEIRVELDVPLEHPSLHFVTPTHAGIRRFPMPEVGATAIVPAPVIPAL